MLKTLKLLVLAACALVCTVHAQPAKSNISTSTIALIDVTLSYPTTSVGQSATQLPDGQWLLLGGQGKDKTVLSDALLVNPKTANSRQLASHLLQARSGHTATLLPNGNVLILGGQDSNGLPISVAEQYSPNTSRFKQLGDLGLIARSGHTATILSDGKVLIAGGVDARGDAIYEVELYNPDNQQAEHINAKLNVARLSHLATLLASDSVLLWGGLDNTKKELKNGELFNSVTQRLNSIEPDQAHTLAQTLRSTDKPIVLRSSPESEDRDIPVNQRLVVRFSKRMDVSTLNSSNVTLLGPNGVTAINPVPVEGGVLLFISPEQELLPATRYTLFIKNASDEAGQSLSFTAIGFDTAQLQQSNVTTSSTSNTKSVSDSNTNTDKYPTKTESATKSDATPKSEEQHKSATLTTADKSTLTRTIEQQEEWQPDASHFKGDWRARRGNSPLQALPPLAAPNGVTALAGQALTLHGRAIADVILKIDDQTAQTDSTGRFLLNNISPGVHTLSIDGNSVNRGGARYGFYQVKVTIKDKQTNVLDYTIWLSRLDPAGTMTIPSPTQNEMVLKSPRIPGLELRIPAGTVIRDQAGKIVTELNMTAIPTDHPPFPIPDVGVPTYFTIQPGGASIQNIGSKTLQGARLIYPNFSGAAPGTRIDFWNYDANSKGWYVYGQGTVSQDGKQVVPDDGVAIYEFTGAMISLPSNAPAEGPPCGGCQAGDPVDIVTGLFIHDRTDLVVADTMPIEVRRTYRPRDTVSRAFGIGTNLSYDLFLVGDTNPWTYQDLILPDGGRIHYVRTSAGTGYSDAVYTHTSSSTKYYGSVISHGSGSCYWRLKFKDGTQICFPESYLSSSARAAAPNSISDSNGNTLNFTRDSKSNLTKVTSPNGRYVQFTYDASNRITQATDNLGRSVNYTYDASGRLSKAIDPIGNFEAYSYDANHRMLTVQDARGNQMVSNIYDANGRVSK